MERFVTLILRFHMSTIDCFWLGEEGSVQLSD